MAKKIIDAHCGTIEVTSSPHGATFRIELPL
jgi:signal transduction histidine kinase